MPQFNSAFPVYLAAGIVSLMSIFWIIVSTKIVIAAYPKNFHSIPLPFNFTLYFYQDYSIYLYAPKAVEAAYTLMASLTTFVTSWKKIQATFFFVALNYAVLNLILIVIYGPCYWIRCPSEAGCSIKSHFTPFPFVPLYIMFQVLIVCLLSFCTKVSNQNLHSGNESSNYNGKFYFVLGKISTDLQLAVLVLLNCVGTATFLLIYMWYTKEFEQRLTWSNAALIALGFFTNFLLLVAALYGFWKKHSAFLIWSLAFAVLLVLLTTVTSTAFIIKYINTPDTNITNTNISNAHDVKSTKKDSAGDACLVAYYAVLAYLLEFMIIRALYMGYNHYKKNFLRIFDDLQIEFNQRLLRILDSQIVLEQHIGAGNFADVHLAQLELQYGEGRRDASHMTVAVKVMKPLPKEEDKRHFLEEAIVLSRLDHEHIIKFKGLCIGDTATTKFCMEYMNGGSLENYLHQEQSRANLSGLDLVEIINQVCQACHYLESKKYVHRDIAARNCLISLQSAHGWSKPNIIKLSDFGLAKDVESQYQNIYWCDSITAPLTHTAPEGLQLRGCFTSKNDVWSFGVLVWEVFSWGAVPYGKCHETSTDQHRCPLLEIEDTRDFVVNQQRTLLDCNEPCTASFTENLKTFLRNCWQYQRHDRPSFSTIQIQIEVLKEGFNDSPCFRLHTTSETVSDVSHEHAMTLNEPSTSNPSSSTDTPMDQLHRAEGTNHPYAMYIIP